MSLDGTQDFQIHEPTPEQYAAVARLLAGQRDADTLAAALGLPA